MASTTKSKSDARLRRAEPVANQRPEDDGGADSESEQQQQQQQLELEAQTAVDVSKRRRATPCKSPPRTPPPARFKRSSPPPLKRTARALSDVSDLRGANLPPLPLGEGVDDESLAQFRARFERGEFFVRSRRSAAAAAQPSQSA